MHASGRDHLSIHSAQKAIMRYFLHQDQAGQTVRDPEGSEHATLLGAIDEAVDAARDMMSNAVRLGRDITDWNFEITNGVGGLEHRLRFGSTISVMETAPVPYVRAHPVRGN